MYSRNNKAIARALSTGPHCVREPLVPAENRSRVGFAFAVSFPESRKGGA